LGNAWLFSQLSPSAPLFSVVAKVNFWNLAEGFAFSPTPDIQEIYIAYARADHQVNFDATNKKVKKMIWLKLPNKKVTIGAAK